MVPSIIDVLGYDREFCSYYSNNCLWCEIPIYHCSPLPWPKLTHNKDTILVLVPDLGASVCTHGLCWPDNNRVTTIDSNTLSISVKVWSGSCNYNN